MRRGTGRLRAAPLAAAIAALLIAGALAGGPTWAQTVRQMTDERTAVAGPPALSDAGDGLFAGSSADPLGVNPRHAFQVLRWTLPGGATAALTGLEDGASALVTVSDDGAWISFASGADPLGTNHDQGPELFLARSDGSEIRQLTREDAVDGGSVSLALISGDGQSVAFLANTDPLGLNPGHRRQLFLVAADGSNLRQLTQAAGGGFGAVGISDDGARLVFVHSGDLASANPDGGDEVFAIAGDGSGLRQLTSAPAGFGATAAALSGDGQSVAFQSDADLTGGNAVHQDEIFLVGWDGTGLRQLTTTTTALGVTGDPASQAPSISDDGQLVVYHSNQGSFLSNLDGNFEIYRINADGSGRQMLTSTLLQAGSFLPVLAGGGGRIGYYRLGGALELRAMDAAGGGDELLLSMDTTLQLEPEIARDGSRVVWSRRTGLLGGAELYSAAADGGTPAPLTALGGGTAATPSIGSGGQLVAFSADSNPGGGLANLDGSREIFRVQIDGGGLLQLTSGPSGTSSEQPDIAEGGSWVVFSSDADLAGANADGSREIFRVAPGGGAALQLTSGLAGTTSRAPRIDDAGAWIVFESNADLSGANADGGYEIFRADGAGANLVQISGPSLADSRAPDLSGDGRLVVYASSADPTGGNADGNSEIFLYDAADGSTRQLTDTLAGGCGAPRISADGARAVFICDAPLAEDDPDRPADLYRVELATGRLERIGALRSAALGGLGPVAAAGGSSIAVDGAGARVTFGAAGDPVLENADLLNEIWLTDDLTPPRLSVSAAQPTTLAWRAESGPLRYDVIRGDVSALALSTGGDVDLGAVSCIEDDSPDFDTLDFADAALPAPGAAWFYLYRGSPGLLLGPGSYGQSSAGGQRGAGVGDCAP